MASGSQNMTTFKAKGLTSIANTVDTSNFIFLKSTAFTADQLGNTVSLSLSAAAVTGAAMTNHSLFLNAGIGSGLGTPFQLQIPDSSHLYIYKRWYTSGAWSGWSKVSAGHADDAAKLLDSAHSWTATEVYNYMTARVLKAGDTMTGQLYINYNQDVGLNQNGSLIIGPKGGENIGIDGNEIMARNNSAASTLYLNSEGGNVYIGSGGVSSVGTVASTAGYLKSTLNGNTVQIGSQNADFCHITNSKAIPFWFNQNIQMEKGKVIGGAGTNYRPFQLYLGRHTTAASNALNAANPLIEFSNSDRSQYCQLMYDDHDSVVAPDSLTLVGNQDGIFFICKNGPIWVQGGSNAGGNVNRLTTSAGTPGNMQYNTSRRGVQIYANGIAFADPYNGNSNNDAGWIRHIEETANTGTFEFAVGDDNANEAIVFRRYTTSNTVGKEVYIFDASGNSSFPGTVTATKFSGPLTGNVTGNCSGSSGSCTGNAATATKATQDGSGNTITNKYFQIYNTAYQGNSSSVTVNDLASQGPAYGMIYAATDNPTGDAGWVHVLNMAWEKTNASWIGQIALSTGGHWIKFRGNGSGAISGVAWKTCCDLESTQNFTGNKSWGSNGAGGILYGNATNGGINSIRIGDDVYLGDCNAGGIMGMKSTGTNCGFYMYNSSGTQIGQLYFNGTNLVCNKTISADITGSSGSCTGNAATATTANGLATLVYASRNNHSGDTGVIVQNTDSTNPLKIGYIIGNSGNGGIYDFTHGVWKVQIAPNGTTTFNGNAATATKLGTANKGSSNHPIYLSGGTPTECAYPKSGAWWTAVPFIHSDGMMEIGRYIDFHGTKDMTGDHTIRLTCATNTARIDCNGVFTATGWSDLAEYRRTIEHEPGRAVIPTDCGIAKRATGRLQPGARIVSDTYGFCLGESDDEQSPIALTGRVLAYPCRPFSEYHAGDAVCSGPNGTVDLMTREEIQKYPDCIIGIVNEIPTYPIWNPKHTDDRQKVVFNENVEVRGRIWIDVK